MATRKSPLALWQAEFVASRITDLFPGISVELIPISTRGDEILDRSLSKIGGKGLFIKELEAAMLEGMADIAVHSMKDVPADLPPGLSMAAILERQDPRDVLVSHESRLLADLADNAVVGTSSLRRQAQLLNLRPDLRIKPLRGNVGTRLQKFDNGEFDAIILAAAGLIRLGKENRISQFLDTQLCMPAAGQGAIGIECCSDNDAILKMLKRLQDPLTTACIATERAVTQFLGSSCTSPVAAYAIHKNGIITLTARVAAPDGAEILEVLASGPPADADAIGNRAAQKLINLGAQQYLDVTE